MSWCTTINKQGTIFKISWFIFNPTPVSRHSLMITTIVLMQQHRVPVSLYLCLGAMLPFQNLSV